MRTICSRYALLLAVLSLLTVAGPAPRAEAASASQIDAAVASTLQEFFRRIDGAQQVVAKSAAVLVFPSVIRAGIGVGGEFGEGALLTREKTVDYYNIVSASIGFQLGAQSRSVILIFMTPEALSNFRRRHGLKIGVDASVAIVTIGAGGSIDTARVANPIIGFIFDGKGLMFNMTLEGSKITRIRKS